ncbi:MAG TPA: tRNA 2-selenouridine(34) synthase MnmH [Bacteroidetes bacterium]|nr:tRNA 2-selenouridine(34) synthase MnmH [Bacteroidota bacterium]
MMSSSDAGERSETRVHRLEAEAFIRAARGKRILDVRTPGEFAKGHLPGASNLPLFSDAERAEIGTLYKQVGREQAILRGLEIVGPKMEQLVRAAHIDVADPAVYVHCWRGGMRSESLAWLLGLSGARAHVLIGGYKAFRNFALKKFAQPLRLIILGGRTGSGKTGILHALQRLGEQIIDLEELALHKGSVFGGLHSGQPITQQTFENALAVALEELDPSRPVWVEDESQRIGRVRIPDDFWRQMAHAPAVVVEMPVVLRKQIILADYGDIDRDQLSEAVQRIEKHLGGLRTRQVIEAIACGNLDKACDLLIPYYDKRYDYALQRRHEEDILSVRCETCVAEDNAAKILQAAEALLNGMTTPPLS